MKAFLQSVFRWLARHAVLLVVVIGMLAAVPYIRKEFTQFKSIIGELAILRDGGKEALEDHLRSIEQEASKRIATFMTASLDRLKSQVDAIEKEIQQKKALRQRGADSSPLSDLLSGKRFMDRLKHDAEIMVLEHERDYLKSSIAFLIVVKDREAAETELERLRKVHSAAYAKLEQIKSELVEAEKGGFWKTKILIWTREYQDLLILQKAYDAQFSENVRAYEDYERQRKLVASIIINKLPPFTMPPEHIDKVLGPLYERIKDLEERIRANWVKKIFSLADENFRPALQIVLLIILLPVAIKVFFYFIVAPRAAGRPPIRLLPLSSGNIISRTAEGTVGIGGRKMSAVSQPIVLGENQELLILPGYLLGASLQAKKGIKLLLNTSVPFASLLSGMFLLTRIGPAGSEPCVISSTKDPLSEVGIIDLPEGAAFVCQPRSLAGVIQDRKKPVRITRHLRLGSLQAWLTLQLRFLVFHGPGQLVLKGCRGIRIESAGTGRLVNQAATLGFSANLDYANTRCEPFIPYLIGEAALFNDLFPGKSGVYVYEEMPDRRQASGITGPWLVELPDAVLSALGI